MNIRFTPLTEEMAREALTWRYPPPFDFYNPPDEITPEMIEALFAEESPQFGVFDEQDRLVGVIGTGIDAQVPGGDYSVRLDTGIRERLQPCQCQKQPCTNTINWYFLNTKSGEPGKDLSWSRYLKPAL